MRQLIRPLVLSIALAVASCRYEGKLPEAAYVPAAAGKGQERIAATAALVDDGSLEKMEISDPHRTYGFKLLIGPALKAALIRQLGESFTSATGISRPEPTDKVDLYVVPEAGWGRAPGSTGLFEYRMVVQLGFFAREAKQFVGGFREAAPMKFSPPAEATAAGLAGAATLFALAPITEPIKADAVGREIGRAAQETIGQIVRKLGDDIAGETRFRDRVDILVSLGPVQPGTGPAGPRDNPPSLYDKFLDAVVMIEAADTSSAAGMIGAGFLISPDGQLVTCRHVVGDATTVVVKDRQGRVFKGEVTASSKERDLALVKISGEGFKTLALAGSVTPPVGREVIAIGAAQGLSWSVSKGIVSGIRSMRTARVIQTDAAFSQGMSGGPLIDVTTGQVIGLHH